jgi:hypothetical protein
MIGGSVDPSSQQFSSAVTISKPSRLCSRFQGSEGWSPIQCADFFVKGGFTVTISEIMNNPQGGGDFEFIEFKNTGNQPISMTGVEFHVDGVLAFKWSDDFSLASNQYFVLADKPSIFRMLYGGKLPDGKLIGTGLTKKSVLSFVSNGQTLYSISLLGVTYGPKGFAIVPLVENDPLTSLSTPTAWKVSTVLNGSPWQGDEGGSPPGISPNPPGNPPPNPAGNLSPPNTQQPNIREPSISVTGSHPTQLNMEPQPPADTRAPSSHPTQLNMEPQPSADSHAPSSRDPSSTVTLQPTTNERLVSASESNVDFGVILLLLFVPFVLA